MTVKKFFVLHWGIILSLIITFVALLPLLHSGFFAIHDDEQIARLYEIDVAVKSFQFPPRWVSHLGFGYGYPLFNFYPPFVYYVGEIFHLLGFSLIISIKMTIGLGFLLATIFMYYWVKNCYNTWAGIIAATLYTYASYHIVDIYVRGALSEFFAFVWIPAIFLSFDKLVRKQNDTWIILSGIFLAFLILTHNLTALASLPFIIVYSLFLIICSKDIVKNSFSFLFSGILGVGLSAYFWLPALIEKQYTLVDTILTRELANYKIHFVYLSQLWSSAWGYGGSALGLADGLSLQVGKISLILSGFCLGFVFLLFIMNKKINPILLCAFLLLLFSLFMTSFYSQFIWDSIHALAYIQFPWRFLLFAAVFSSYLGGAYIKLIEPFLPRNLLIIFCIALIMHTLISIYPSLSPVRYLNVEDNNYVQNHDIEWRVSSLSFEYIPKEVATTKSLLHTTIPAITRNDIPHTTAYVFSGNVTMTSLQNTPTDKRYQVVGKGGNIQINTYNFPGWEVFIDGKKVRVSSTKKLHLITFFVPPGDHSVEILFTNTPIRIVGNSLTLVCIIAIISRLLYIYRIKKWVKKRLR